MPHGGGVVSESVFSSFERVRRELEKKGKVNEREGGSEGRNESDWNA